MTTLNNKCLAVVLLTWAAGPCSAAESPRSDGAIRVPLTFVAGLPTVNASIKGHPVKVFVDLGGYRALGIKPDVASKLPLEVLPGETRARTSAGAEEIARRYSATGLQVGQLTLPAVEVSTLPNNAPYPQDGYIGLGVLANYAMVFDYPHRQLRLYPAGDVQALIRECGTGMRPVGFERGVVQARFETTVGTRVLQLDTGANRNVFRPSALSPPDDKTEQGTMVTLSHVADASGDFGPQAFMALQFAAPDVDGVLGTPFFEHRLVCIDLHSKTWTTRAEP